MMRTDESMRHFRHGRRRAGGAISRQTDEATRETLDGTPTSIGVHVPKLQP